MTAATSAAAQSALLTSAQAGRRAPKRVLPGFGLTLGVSGAALIAAALGRFGKAGTPAEPWKPTTALTTSGVYRLTRNPMYVGMAILLAGLAVGLGSWGALFALPLVCLIIDRFVIVREERYLEDLFGDSYATYRNRVRRWL